MVSPTRAKMCKLYMMGYLKSHNCTISIETLCMNGLILLVSHRRRRSRCVFFTSQENSWHYKGCRNSCSYKCIRKKNSNSNES
jgi:hypothetical protein